MLLCIIFQKYQGGSYKTRKSEWLELNAFDLGNKEGLGAEL